MNAIESRGIKFVNKAINGKISKFAMSSTSDPYINFVTQFKNPQTLNDIVMDINKALNGQFNSIQDPDVSTNIDIAAIAPNGINFYDEEGQNVIATLPLQDFKEMVIAWRDFLLQVPADGSTV